MNASILIPCRVTVHRPRTSITAALDRMGAPVRRARHG